MDRADKHQMATEKQIAANRENGKKSTGPRTKAGKAKVFTLIVGVALTLRSSPETVAAAVSPA